MTDNERDDWDMWWDARLRALEVVLGVSDDMVGHATIPFDLGAELGGAADIVYFRHHVSGIVAVTAELIGNDAQLPNTLGNYELMICHREPTEDWGPELIGRLAHYTLEAELQPGETIDLGPSVPEGSTIKAFLFLEYARFQVRSIARTLGVRTDRSSRTCLSTPHARSRVATSSRASR